MVDRHTGRSRGFGFVTFDKVSDAEEAIKALHETDVDGRKVSVTKAIPQSQTAPGTPASALMGSRRGDRCAKWAGAISLLDSRPETAPCIYRLAAPMAAQITAWMRHRA